MWHSGTVPEIEDFLPVQDSAEFDDQARRNLLAELVMIDLEFRWRRTAAESTATSQEPPDRDGPPHDTLPQRPRLEDYLRRYPQLGPLDELSTELIGEEYRARQRWGDQPSHDDYRRRFPRHDRKLQKSI